MSWNKGSRGVIASSDKPRLLRSVVIDEATCRRVRQHCGHLGDHRLREGQRTRDGLREGKGAWHWLREGVDAYHWLREGHGLREGHAARDWLRERDVLREGRQRDDAGLELVRLCQACEE